jgi:hypothetical protein
LCVINCSEISFYILIFEKEVGLSLITSIIFLCEVMSLCFEGIDVVAVKETRNIFWQHHDAVSYRTSKLFTLECVEAGRLYSAVSVLSGQP